ncbi:ABC-type sulfonate/taurin nitrate/bicarbonate transporter ATP-binding protein [Perkinsela sp. CCAP 1560/4]|nr:ABC-type sulfonate/taurin nitrate/bicarbonate transporter ATP-binding protein [Perkinsela sp. CCAP 1560/4]|eukprot:KNH07375.1 ABC-type sulfonate/taurin nitrate/bicarbonate transporter ATP-binding protein [Perkinsela sp. CCAP 1560/4]
MQKAQAKRKKAPTLSTGILCWVCKDAEEVLRVVRKFRTVQDCVPLLAANEERRLLLENFYGKMPGQAMAYRIVHLEDGKIVVHSADLVYVTQCGQWNDIFLFPTCPMYASNREDAPLISRLTRIRLLEKSDDRAKKALCPLCLTAFDENHQARTHLFQNCLPQLAGVTEAPILL